MVFYIRKAFANVENKFILEAALPSNILFQKRSRLDTREKLKCFSTTSIENQIFLPNLRNKNITFTP